MTNDKSGSPTCGIYIRINDFADMQKIITGFRQMTMCINRASGYEKNKNIVELVYSADHIQQITDLVILAQNERVVAIISGNTPDFECYGADGILLDNIENLKLAREKLGDDAIIGMACGSSKDLAQDAIKFEADYVTLNPDPTIISWCSSQAEVLCASVGGNITSNSCTALALAGADFIDVSDYIFNHKDGVMQGTVNILHALELCVQVPKTLN